MNQLKPVVKLLTTAGLMTLCLVATAQEDTVSRASASPNTTLSAAAQAAKAAAVAAKAAAEAATAAAEAANAALSALGAVLPSAKGKITTLDIPKQKVGDSLPGLAGTPIGLEEGGSVGPSELALVEQSPSKTNAVNVLKFDLSEDRSLEALIGTFEIAVNVDVNGEFTTGLSNFTEQSDQQVNRAVQIDLAEAVRVALGFSREVLAAGARVDIAKAQEGQQKAFLLPNVLLSVKSGKEVSMPGSQVDDTTGEVVSRSEHSRRDRTLTITQPVFDLPNWYEWKRRGVLSQSKERALLSSQGDTYLQTVTAYLDLISTRVRADMSHEYESKLQDLFKYVEKRASAGASNASDKERVKARTLAAQSSQLELEAAHAAAGVEFLRLSNLAPGVMRLPTLEDVGISIVPVSLDQAVAKALDANPEIATLQEELKAAEIDKSGAFGKYLPKLGLEYTDTDTMHAGGAADIQHDRRLMMVMNWQLFNGGGDQKLNEEKTSRAQEIRYRLDDQRRKVLQSLSAQYATLNATQDRISSGYRELKSITSAVDAMSKRMLSGNQSLLDLLDVYDKQYQIRTKLVELHTQEIAAVAEIARLVQGVPSLQQSTEDKLSANAAELTLMSGEENGR